MGKYLLQVKLKRPSLNMFHLRTTNHREMSNVLLKNAPSAASYPKEPPEYVLATGTYADPSLQKWSVKQKW